MSDSDEIDKVDTVDETNDENSDSTGEEAEEDSDTDFLQCDICGIGVRDIDRHLEDEHIDQREELKEKYPERSDEILGDTTQDASSRRPQETTSTENTTVTSDESDEGVTAEATQGEDDLSQSASAEIDDQTTGSTTMGNKWYLIGVGGAGNRIVDTILIRRNSLLDTSKPLAGVWEQALAGHTMLNANIDDMTGTFYYNDNNMNENELLQNCMIGMDHDDNDYTGCGQNWGLGRDFIKKDFDSGDNPLKSSGRYDIAMDQLGRSQAAMISHSVTGGTGCGAAPFLAKKIKESDDIKNKSIFGSIVIPSEAEGEDGAIVQMNGCAGTARMAKFSDAVFIFENDRLSSMNPELQDIDGIERYPKYKDMNNALAKFFEIFSIASINSKNIKGDDFDINDALEPINQRRDVEKEYYDQSDSSDESFSKQPGNVLAPIIARSRAEEMTKTTVQTLAHKALKQNLLADFDPETAWGGTFVFYGPEERMDEKIIREEFENKVESTYLDVEKGRSLVTAKTYIINVQDLNSIYLWGFLWNPKVNSLEEMYDWAEDLKDTNISGAEKVREEWSTVEGLFKLMGRENMGGK